MKKMKKPENITKREIWWWFLSLDDYERARVTSIEDKETVGLILRMYQRKVEEGDGLYFDIGPKEDYFESFDLLLDKCTNVKRGQRRKLKKYDEKIQNDFCFQRFTYLSRYFNCHYPESLISFDKQLEDNIRLCDTCEYLDTITLANSLLSNPQQFLYLMERASRGSFLTSPCKSNYTKISNII
eukprot:TRINITY_DN4782_c2_g2_i2.p1 TRINITY_DN4782_c2_g2~~TRINITY_DN4782_c2_g2_i2.p1  ORF type:complete len:184 (+),score=38.21 TRINITY_DN4782_c2_g2_i2:209-760(+)